MNYITNKRENQAINCLLKIKSTKPIKTFVRRGINTAAPTENRKKSKNQSFKSPKSLKA